MEQTHITAARQRFAASDMRYARKDGEVAITQTTRGTVFLRYNDGTYTLDTAGLNPETLATGKAAAVKPTLMTLYTVAGQ